MAYIVEEKLREAACIGDSEAIETILTQNIDINSKNAINGWTALHWACKRGNDEVVRILMNNGADPNLKNNKGETAITMSANNTILELLGVTGTVTHLLQSEEPGIKFVPNYLKNAPLNGHVDIGPRLRSRHADKINMPMPTTTLRAQSDDLVLKVRIAGSKDPDYIEIEIPRWKLTYTTLMRICCEELEVSESQIERIRKLPNTRLRKDSDVKRLIDLQCLEIVMKSPLEKCNNGYQSISFCKDQTILY